MEKRKVMITGAFGFIGSNLVINWLINNPNDDLILLDGMTYAARPDYLKDFLNDTGMWKRITEVVCNICDLDGVHLAMQAHKPDLVLHLAAESHVCRSIEGPAEFVFTNIVGTFHLLEEFRKLWNGNPEKKFIHVSTDEVYGELELHEDPFQETSAIKPRSPYAASKASSDLLALSYFHTYHVPVIVTNCSNNFGPNQHEEKLIPATIMRLIKGEKPKLYGNGKQIRDWLWVIDHCSALMLLAEKGVAGERYCIGGEDERTNQEIIHMIADILEIHLQKQLTLEIEYTNDRPTDDRRYAIDCSKLKELGWKPSKRIEEHISSTIEYYVHECQKAGLLGKIEGEYDAQ